ncbi:MAG: cyclase [Cyanobacteria bacterium RM1_2_2]|nr:cyclase [Cyanobacteria bacterium RM1_2_2]
MTEQISPMETNEELELLCANEAEADAELEKLLEGSQFDVEVTTDRAMGRERQISAKIRIPHPIERVWQILTDYDHLADFIPSLARSRRIQHPQGGIRIEQIGTQALLRVKFCARVVLDMVEQMPHQLDFQMVEGDFKAFSGNWKLQPLANGTTELCYTVVVLPPRTMPIGLIERKLKGGLVANLSAIRQRADELFGSN